MALRATTALADVAIELVGSSYNIIISGTISKDDANKIAQREAGLEFGFFDPVFNLNSLGGDLDAAMLIGRIVRRIEGRTLVAHDARCFSSCALIYIAGVNRLVKWDLSGSGLIGLHRPYFASSPQRRETIERETPKMSKRCSALTFQIVP
jgi:hypothetical protein